MQTLLLVEDEPEKLRHFKRAAEGDDRRILSSPDLAGALRLITSENLDLVVTDLALHSLGLDHDGFEVLQAAKAKDPEVPVILVSNYLTPDVSDEALAQGAFDIVDRATSTIDSYKLLRLKIGQALRLRGALLSR